MKTLATSTHKRVSEPLKSLAYKRIYKPLKYYCVSFQQKNNHSLFAININFDSGFFAQLSWCLDIFAYCEHLKLKPYIILSGTNYTNPDKGNNWLDYFFINAQLSNDDFNRIKSNKITIS